MGNCDLQVVVHSHRPNLIFIPIFEKTNYFNSAPMSRKSNKNPSIVYAYSLSSDWPKGESFFSLTITCVP